MKKSLILFLLMICLALLLSQPVQAASQGEVETPDAESAVAAPVVVSPHANQKSVPKASFVWKTVSGATQYMLEIRKNSDNTLAFRATYDAAALCSGSYCTVTIDKYLSVRGYQWRVAAYVGTEKGAWSTTTLFYVWDKTLGWTKVIYPAANAVVTLDRPILRWKPTTGALNYYLEVLDATGKEVGFWYVSGSVCDAYCEFRLPSSLYAKYGDYRWRVQPFNNINKTIGPWSAQRTFTYTRIASPTNISPGDDTLTGAHQPTFEWGTVSGAYQYIIQISDADTGYVYYQKQVSAADACGSLSCELTIDSMLAGGNYQWRVRGKSGGNYGFWSTYWTFTMSGSTYKYTNTFGSDPTDWMDPDNRWLWDVSLYRGSPSTVCMHYCALTYYPQNFTDASFIIKLRTSGDDAADGYKILWRALYDEAGDLTQAYLLEVKQDGSSMVAEINRYDRGTVYVLGSQSIPGQSITNFHTVEVRLDHNAFQLLYNGYDMGTYDVMLDSYYYGTFAVDVTSWMGNSQSVEVDTVDIEVPGS